MKYPGQERRGNHPLSTLFAGILPPPRVLPPVPKATGRGAGGQEHVERGRKEAALLGELMAVSGEH